MRKVRQWISNIGPIYHIDKILSIKDELSEHDIESLCKYHGIMFDISGIERLFCSLST